MAACVSPRSGRQTEGYSLDLLLYWTLHEHSRQKKASDFNLKNYSSKKKKKKKVTKMWNQTNMLAQVCFFNQCRSSVVQPNIISINTGVFTASVLTRPQHGMWPTRWLHGPFLFLNHLILCPLRWKLTPLNQRSWAAAFSINDRVRLAIFCCLKETHKARPASGSLWRYEIVWD